MERYFIKADAFWKGCLENHIEQQPLTNLEKKGLYYAIEWGLYGIDIENIPFEDISYEEIDAAIDMCHSAPSEEFGQEEREYQEAIELSPVANYLKLDAFYRNLDILYTGKKSTKRPIQFI